MENKKLSRIYYSPKGFWKGLPAVKKLSQEAGVSEDEAKLWLMKQAIWQIYLPAPRGNIPRPSFDVNFPNAVHQADLLFLPHDKLPRGKKIFKYALTVVDIASRFKAAEPLTSKDSSEVSRAFRKIYKGPLKWPKILQVDPGREFMGKVTEEMKDHDVRIRRGNVNVHRDQGIVERFNRSLSKRLFSFQYSQEMNLKSGERSTEWVKRLPEVVSALNSEKTRLTGRRPVHNNNNNTFIYIALFLFLTNSALQDIYNLTSHRIINKGCETGPPVYRPYPRRLESLTICRCNYKGSTFSSVI